MPLKDTVRSFAAIVDGEADDLPEWAFFNVGSWKMPARRPLKRWLRKRRCRLMNKFMLNITASSGEFYQATVRTSCCPPATVCMACRPGTTPCWSAIHMGILHFEVNGEARDILVGDGIAEVTPRM